MTDIVSTALIIFRTAIAFLFLLIVPGYAILYVLFPRGLDIPSLDRLILSGTVSIGTVITAVLVMDFVVGIDTTPGNIFLFLVIVTVLALVLWRTELYLLSSRNSAVLACIGLTTCGQQAIRRVIKPSWDIRGKIVDKVRVLRGKHP